jgi:hypothetical protein
VVTNIRAGLPGYSGVLVKVNSGPTRLRYHGNALRALKRYLPNLDQTQITGPFLFDCTSDELDVRRHGSSDSCYSGDQFVCLHTARHGATAIVVSLRLASLLNRGSMRMIPLAMLPLTCAY